MTHRAKWSIIGLIAAVVEVILISAWLAYGELPKGMHQANVVIEDTVVFRPVPSMERSIRLNDSLDSVFNERARQKAFDKRRRKIEK